MLPIPQTLLEWLGLAGWALCAAMVLWHRYTRESGKVAAEVIELLEKQKEVLREELANQKQEHDKEVQALTAKYDEAVGELKEKLGEMAERFYKMQGEYNVMQQLLQGRDEKSLEFQTRAIEAMELGKSTNQYVIKLAELLERHMSAIEKKI